MFSLMIAWIAECTQSPTLHRMTKAIIGQIHNWRRMKTPARDTVRPTLV